MSEEIDALPKAKVPRNYLHSRSLAAKTAAVAAHAASWCEGASKETVSVTVSAYFLLLS